MKNPLLYLLLLLIMYQQSYSQDDKQWLILNEKGKQGLDANGNNKYVNNMTNQFMLENVTYPSPIITGARNDFFVIYKDGKHFNSRSLQAGLFFYPGPSDSQTSLSHNFSSLANSNIKWLYMTNRYEEDDPPELLNVKPNTNPTGTVHKFGVTNNYLTGGLQLDHDVTRSKDLTLIIDQNAFNDSLSHSSYRVVFDSLLPLKAGLAPVWSPSFFDLRPVFNISGRNFAAFPLTTCDTGGGPINVPLKFIPDSTFTYLNLRLKNISDYYMPDRDGSARFAAVFKIVENRSNAIVQRAVHPLLNSADPNFIRIDSICRNKNDSMQMVYYYIQFRNTSKTNVASGLEVKFFMPNGIIPSCFKILEWSPNSTVNHFSLVNGEYQFVFNPASFLSVCPNTNDRGPCTGFIRFKIGIPKNIDLTNGANSLELIRPRTVFDKVPYAITDFRDILIPEKENFIRIISEGDCKCQKPFCKLCVVGALAATGILLLLLRRVRRGRKRP